MIKKRRTVNMNNVYVVNKPIEDKAEFYARFPNASREDTFKSGAVPTDRIEVEEKRMDIVF
ncbi:hypothetical protein [Chengkuizengella axinellae]|uniref:Uncharacterized protein n=1 Tax=Chengkuizengella axinellae TaxID=3064388 RepID=A0ABT9IV27_9BACL|nr:hypothetical protein [Chengkuizengella sp. 2205SS18-9]MDP5273219.1 hypothetical protein [Chengkuizengella sp. 2205SS18-9]